MQKAVISEITKELTLQQQAAHNDNYKQLADKDLEMFGELSGRIDEAAKPKMLNGTNVGTIAFNYDVLYFPVALTFTNMGTGDTPKFFFSVDKDFVTPYDGIYLDLVYFNSLTRTWLYITGPLRDSGDQTHFIQSVYKDKTYAFVPRREGGAILMCVHEAGEDDFVTMEV